MALTKTTTNDKIEVLALAAGYPIVQVRTAMIISEDGVEISRTFHRHVLTPDADLSAEDADVVAIASAVFTDEAKAAYAGYLAAQKEAE
jgi:predicted regulator of Ras-like GTPase activity (Roadblock/LC7/MglB family)